MMRIGVEQNLELDNHDMEARGDGGIPSHQTGQTEAKFAYFCGGRPHRINVEKRFIPQQYGTPFLVYFHKKNNFCKQIDWLILLYS